MGLGWRHTHFAEVEKGDLANSNGPAANWPFMPPTIERFEEIANDPNTSRTDRGWIKQEQNGDLPVCRIKGPARTGLVHDLVESALQKLTNVNAESVARAFVEIAEALLNENAEKVVVLAHSQGSIVMGDVLDLSYCGVDVKYLDRTNMNDRDLEEFLGASHGTVPAYLVKARFDALKDQAELVMEKLELYMFANAASRMCYLDPQGFRPHIESFVNERDIVTRLGALAPDAFHREDRIRIDGPVFSRRRSGRLLNSHYLPGLHAKEYELPPAIEGNCIGSSVHDDVEGPSRDKNPLRTAGTTSSRLHLYLHQAPVTDASADTSQCA